MEIQHQTKTCNSTRIIPLSNNLVFLLRKLQKFQKDNKKAFGKLYYNYNMVLSRRDGYYLDHDTVLSKYNEIVKKANVKKCTIHALRHTFATRALESGVPIKVISNILGHSTVQFTMDTYTHVLDEIKLSEMDRIDKYINSFVNVKLCLL